MIYTLTIECIDGWYLTDKCVRVLEIKKDVSLCALRFAIHDVFDFDFDHLHAFYVSRTGNPRGKKYKPGRQENESQDDYYDLEWNVDDLLLKDVWPLGRNKLYYYFDFGDNWIFEIRKARGEKPADENVSYPRVIKSIGPIPKQYPSWDE